MYFYRQLYQGQKQIGFLTQGHVSKGFKDASIRIAPSQFQRGTGLSSTQLSLAISSSAHHEEENYYM